MRTLTRSLVCIHISTNSRMFDTRLMDYVWIGVCPRSFLSSSKLCWWRQCLPWSWREQEGQRGTPRTTIFLVFWYIYWQLKISAGKINSGYGSCNSGNRNTCVSEHSPRGTLIPSFNPCYRTNISPQKSFWSLNPHLMVFGDGSLERIRYPYIDFQYGISISIWRGIDESLLFPHHMRTQ